MKTKFIFFLIFTITINSGVAQQAVQTVKGKIVDADLGSSIPGANIVLLNSDPIYGTVSDLDGNFKLENVPLGRQSFRITSIGYETTVINNVLVTAGKELDLTVKLLSSIVEMKEFVVESEEDKTGSLNQMATVSARTFSVEETKRYAGSFDDPGRMAQSFAGVSSNNDNTNEIVIRGNSPRGVLWRMEGIEIPNPNHFSDQGASGGAISMLSSNMMTNSDFFTGAFPSEYGNALSGVFDINLRKGNNEKREYAFQLGVLGTDFALEGPFKKGYAGSYLINYRYSTLSLLNKIGIKIVGDAVPVFQDLTFNFQLPTKKLGNFSVFGIGGNSRVNESWEDSSNTWNSEYSVWMGVAGITHTYFLNSSSYLKTILTANVTSNGYLENKNDSLDQFLYSEYNQDFSNTAFRGSISYNNKINNAHLLKIGFVFSQINFDFFSQDYDESIQQQVKYLDQKGNSAYSQLYASWKYRIKENLTLQSGIHTLFFHLNSNYSVEPRLGLKWDISPRQQLSFGAGIHSRIEDLTVYMSQKTLPDNSIAIPNKNLDFTKAAHFVLGYNISFTENLRLKPEIYFQYLYNVPIIDLPNSSFSGLNYSDGFTTDSLLNKGSGKNIGIDLTLERFFNNSWFFMLTGSFYNSTYVAGDKIERNTRYNGNYATCVVGGKEFVITGKKGNKNILSISTRANLSGGRRYTPILLDESNALGYAVYDESKIFAAQQQEYFRIDFQISYKRNRKNTTRTWKIDAQNVTNRQNLYGQYYDANAKAIRTSTQMGFIPVLSYKIEF